MLLRRADQTASMQLELQLDSGMSEKPLASVQERAVLRVDGCMDADSVLVPALAPLRYTKTSAVELGDRCWVNVIVMELIDKHMCEAYVS